MSPRGCRHGTRRSRPSTVCDHRGVPCLLCHHACSSRSSPGSTPCSGEHRGGESPEFHPDHPLRCHRRRVPGRVVFKHVIDALVHGSGYERLGFGPYDLPPSEGVVRAGDRPAVHAVALAAYDLIIGLELEEMSVDGCITTAPCGGEGRSVAGGPTHTVPSRARRPPRPTVFCWAWSPPGPTGTTRRCWGQPWLPRRPRLGRCPTRSPRTWTSPKTTVPPGSCSPSSASTPEISRKGVPCAIQVGKRWVVERTNSWMNGYGKLRRCTDRDGAIVDFYLYLAAALLTVRRLIQRARTLYRWDTRPTVRRLK